MGYTHPHTPRAINRLHLNFFFLYIYQSHKRLDGFNCIRLFSLYIRSENEEREEEEENKKRAVKFSVGILVWENRLLRISKKKEKKLLNHLNSFELAVFLFLRKVHRTQLEQMMTKERSVKCMHHKTDLVIPVWAILIVGSHLYRFSITTISFTIIND